LAKANAARAVGMLEKLDLGALHDMADGNGSDKVNFAFSLEAREGRIRYVGTGCELCLRPTKQRARYLTLLRRNHPWINHALFITGTRQ